MIISNLYTSAKLRLKPYAPALLAAQIVLSTRKPLGDEVILDKGFLSSYCTALTL